MELTRRELLAGLAAAPLLGLPGCERPPQISGKIVGPNSTIGHRLRDGWRPVPSGEAWETVDVVIVGGGVAGLSAARELQRQGVSKFVVLELEDVAGGTSRSGSLSDFVCPWGAHYLPLPQAHQSELIAFLQECGVVTGVDAQGRPQVPEEALCRDPEERLFFQGEWIEGLYPFPEATPSDLAEWAAFQAEMQQWAEWRDTEGRPAFAIPTRLCSPADEVRQLDQLSFAEWLDQRGWHSSRLRWVLDYCCRDDYGLRLEQTSAWAGIFYFAARVSAGEHEPQPLLTWPDGNGFLVRKLYEQCPQQYHGEMAVTEIQALPAASTAESTSEFVAVTTVHTRTEVVRGYRARRVIFACPQFLAPALLHGWAADVSRFQASRQFRYGSWLVANVALRERPASPGFPLAWDNVLYDSDSLGYVVATHQLGQDFGPTVVTWYEPWCDEDPAAARKRLLELSWPAGALRAIADLERAHPDIRPLISRIDLLKWGHAMIAPVPGFCSSDARQLARQPWRGVHFAHTDLSGIALFEEAFDHGQRAAREVAAALAETPT